MTRADRLVEALQRINAIDGGDYPCAEIALAQEIAMEALSAYRGAPADPRCQWQDGPDGERCANEAALCHAHVIKAGVKP